MKRFSSKHLKKKTKTLFRFSGARGSKNGSETTNGQTDPTSSTITILTTVSGVVMYTY